MKLNLGCFNKKIHGFTNVDCREDVKPDVVDDIKTLNNFEKNSAELILAVHVLEHLSRKDVNEALKRWFDILKPNGKVMIAVPNMDAVFAHYFYWKDLKLLYSSLGGSQRHEADFHFSHFDFVTLKELLENTGFKDVKLYDRWKTDWAHCDDYSASYVPHMDFKNGKLMSLNMQGEKPY